MRGNVLTMRLNQPCSLCTYVYIDRHIRVRVRRRVCVPEVAKRVCGIALVYQLTRRNKNVAQVSADHPVDYFRPPCETNPNKMCNKCKR